MTMPVFTAPKAKNPLITQGVVALLVQLIGICALAGTLKEWAFFIILVQLIGICALAGTIVNLSPFLGLVQLIGICALAGTVTPSVLLNIPVQLIGICALAGTAVVVACQRSLVQLIGICALAGTRLSTKHRNLQSTKNYNEGRVGGGVIAWFGFVGRSSIDAILVNNERRQR